MAFAIKKQINKVMQRMASVFDEQNKNTEGYRPMISQESKNFRVHQASRSQSSLQA